MGFQDLPKASATSPQSGRHIGSPGREPRGSVAQKNLQPALAVDGRIGRASPVAR